MKRIVASIGVATLGAACIQSASAQGDGAKPWSVSVALRGFYDDNINTAKNGEVDTFGGEINPSVAFSLGGKEDATRASLAYTYGFKYYDTMPAGNTSHYDQTHTIAAALAHSFNERTAVSLSDSFVIGQEPDVLRAGANGDFATFQRISGQNVRNLGSIALNHQFAPKFGIEVGYVNSLFDYEDDEVRPLNTFPFFTPSNSGLLDRMEQTVHIDARWTIQPTTVGLIGYAYSYDHYTANQPIGRLEVIPFPLVNSDDRDTRSHYVYGGVEHAFRSDLHANLRVGARFTDYFNSPTSESGTSPYVLASLTYDFSKESSFQVGVSHDLSATDTFTTQGSSITSDSEVTVVYASFTHHILPSLVGSLMGQFQNSQLNGGAFDGDSEQYYLLSANLSYQINRHLAANVSYHYDLLESGVGRGFDRNRVYLGATFTY